jgi:hypothetical protein
MNLKDMKVGQTLTTAAEYQQSKDMHKAYQDLDKAIAQLDTLVINPLNKVLDVMDKNKDENFKELEQGKIAIAKAMGVLMKVHKNMPKYNAW